MTNKKANKYLHMKIALIQSSLFWENPAKNRNAFEQKINSITDAVDLIILPEMFTTGFTMQPHDFAESMQGETLNWLILLSKAKNTAITGSLIIVENKNFYNRLVFVFPSGEIQFYDKKHLFTLAGEDKVYDKGYQKIIIDYLGWKICPLVCYDLRFPVFSRNTENYDLLLYVASWPKARINAWDVLLKARAIENMCYTIGVNRTGKDANGYQYNGHSQAIDFIGNFVQEPQEAPGIFILTLHKKKMLEARQRLDFLSDQDVFMLK